MEPTKWSGHTKALDLVHICGCARVSVIFAGASSCILVHLTPKSWGRMIARRLFSIPVRCLSDWQEFSMWMWTCEHVNMWACEHVNMWACAHVNVNTNIRISIRRDCLTSWSSRCWSTNWSSCKTIIIHSLRCIGSWTSQSGPQPQHCWQCTFSRNIVDNNDKRNILHNIVDDVLFIRIVCLKNICVFSHYILWYMIVYIIRYLCIFSLHVECYSSRKSLIDGSSC